MKLLVTDYDGTVTHEGLTPGFRNALAEWQAAGNLFVIDTGRPVFSISDTCFMNHITPDYIIADNGAVVCDRDLKPVFVRELGLREAVAAVKHAAENYVTSYFRAGNTFCYCCGMHAPESVYAEPENALLGCDYFSIKHPTELCMRFGTGEMRMQFQKEVPELTGGKLHGLSSSSLAVDIVCSDVDKATGIRFLLKAMDLHPERIYTCGDAGNDLAMLTDPEFEGWCIDKSTDEVKQVIHNVVKSPREIMERFI